MAEGTTYSLTFDSNGGSYCEPIYIFSESVEAGSHIITYLPTPTKNNYFFDGWYYKNSTIKVKENDIIYNDVVLYAKWVWSKNSKYQDFLYKGEKLSDYNGFIINEGQDLKFFNPTFNHEFASPQFTKKSYFLGTTIEKREFNFSIILKEITLQKYREFLAWLNPKDEGVLSFDYNPDYGYEVKLNSISEGTFYVVRECSSNQTSDKYNIELEVNFVTKNDWTAKWINEYDAGNPNFIVRDNDEYTVTNMSSTENYLIIEFNSSLTVTSSEGTEIFMQYEGPIYDTTPKTYFSEYGVVLDSSGNFINAKANILKIPPYSSSKYFIAGQGISLTSITVTSREII